MRKKLSCHEVETKCMVAYYSQTSRIVQLLPWTLSLRLALMLPFLNWHFSFKVSVIFSIISHDSLTFNCASYCIVICVNMIRHECFIILDITDWKYCIRNNGCQSSQEIKSNQPLIYIVQMKQSPMFQSILIYH